MESSNHAKSLTAENQETLKISTTDRSDEQNDNKLSQSCISEERKSEDHNEVKLDASDINDNMGSFFSAGLNEKDEKERVVNISSIDLEQVASAKHSSGDIVNTSTNFAKNDKVKLISQTQSDISLENRGSRRLVILFIIALVLFGAAIIMYVLHSS